MANPTGYGRSRLALRGPFADCRKCRRGTVRRGGCPAQMLGYAHPINGRPLALSDFAKGRTCLAWPSHSRIVGSVVGAQPKEPARNGWKGGDSSPPKGIARRARSFALSFSQHIFKRRAAIQAACQQGSVGASAIFSICPRYARFHASGEAVELDERTNRKAIPDPR